jgi:hypothetical protein
MGYVKPLQAENTVAPTSQLEGRGAAHAADADNNDVICHAHPVDLESRIRSPIEPISYHPIFCVLDWR